MVGLVPTTLPRHVVPNVYKCPELHLKPGSGGFLESGVPFGASHNEDCGILGSILGSPSLGKLPCRGQKNWKGVLGNIL